MPKNRTERLKLRALEPEDLNWLMDLENDPSHWMVGDRQLPLSRAAFRSYIENASETLEQAGQFRWVIERIEDEQPLGLLDLYAFSDRHQRASVGILVQSQFRGQGYAKEALKWLIAYASQIGQLHQLHAEIDSENTQSIELFQACGFDKSGILKEWLRRGGHFVDVWQMQRIL